MILISVPRSSRWVAKLWRSACSVTSFDLGFIDRLVEQNSSWRVVIGVPGRRPGNSQRS